MNENIDLVEILKDCPKETKLYSTIYGEVEFDRIEKGDIYSVISVTNCGTNCIVTSDGRYCNSYNGECTLFPSKDQRDWSKFTAPWYKKESNTIEQSQTNEHMWLHLVSDVLTWKDGIGQYLDNPEVQEIAKKLCSKYAQKLYNPSVISSSSNTVKNEQKFDPKTLKSFDKVLCRNGLDIWRCDFFSSYKETYACKNVCIGGSYLYCIPYNDETKHLIGKAKEAPEYYRYWEN